MWQLVTAAVDAASRAKATRDTNRANLEAIRLTNEGQMKLAEYQYEKNLEQWHRENAYNDPSSQMQRLANAGLNPHLVYEKGSAVQPSAASPQYDAPNLQAYHQDASPWQDVGLALRQGVNAEIDTYLRREMQKEQINHMWWQNDLLMEQAESERKKQSLFLLTKMDKLQDVRKKRIENEIYKDLLESQLKNNNASTNYINSQKARVDEEISMIKAETTLRQAQAATEKFKQDLTAAQAQEARARCAEIAADIAKTYQEIEESKARGRYYDAQTTLIRMKSRFQAIVNRNSSVFGDKAPWWLQLMSGVLEEPAALINTLFDFAPEATSSMLERTGGVQNLIGLGFNSVLFNPSAAVVGRSLGIDSPFESAGKRGAKIGLSIYNRLTR